MTGQTISHYKIVEKLGGGGMGVVYKARDLKLDRFVALKFLPHEIGAEEEYKRRFIHEAKAASALDHNNICTIYEVDETGDGQMFIAMAFYKGETLKKKIQRRPLPLAEALDFAMQVGQGLAKAHQEGIVHRDIKPANVMVTEDGVVKIVDFGLAQLGDATKLTKTGSSMGTPAYMSPEQVQRQTIDRRSDIWSLGAVIYEMITGQVPFKGQVEAAVAYSILHEQPEPMTALRTGVPTELDRLVTKALAKSPTERYQHAEEILVDLRAAGKNIGLDANLDRGPLGEPPPEKRSNLRRQLARPKIAVPALLVLLALGWAAVGFYQRHAKARWAEREAIPLIARLIEENEYSEAFRIAEEAGRYAPGNHDLQDLWSRVSREVSVETTPSGADLYIQPYAAPESPWRHVGQSPAKLRLPMEYFKWKISRPGYGTLLQAPAGNSGPLLLSELQLQLYEEGRVPEGMVPVPGGILYVQTAGLGTTGPIPLDEYFIDKYEVTNLDFKKFVDAGAYQTDKHWKHEFVTSREVLSWAKARELFQDRTGRPGPSTWEFGTYPSGEENHPVSGVSWYEAAAYCESTGKRLPTIYHWYRAASIVAGRYIVPLSNFSGSRTAPVGSHQAMSDFGSYDMAGNVREWCWNPSAGATSENLRFALGGAYGEPSYMFGNLDGRDAFDRSPGNGFRCALHPGDVPEDLTRPIKRLARDYSMEKPVSEEIFAIYERMYKYEPRELNASTDQVDDTAPHWVKQRITFDAAYRGERIIAYLFLPRNASPPYQPVIYFPGLGAARATSSQNLPMVRLVEPVIRSGRAVVYPVYSGTYERGGGALGTVGQIEERDLAIQQVKDLSRSIDYLQTRADIDKEKIGYLGFSWGARFGAVPLALENRLKAAVLVSGGLPQHWSPLPEADPLNFAPRVKQPVLLVAGRHDYLYPVESSQLPLLQSLGTPEIDKRHVIVDGPHAIPPHEYEYVSALLDFLDRYLGPVN